MAGSQVTAKLRIKPADRVLLLHPPAGYADGLAPAAAEVVVDDPSGGPFEVVQLFAMDLADLGREAPRAIAAVAPGGILWVSYRKQRPGLTSDLNRDTCRAAIQPTGWDTVSQVAIDEVWSALRPSPPPTSSAAPTERGTRSPRSRSAPHAIAARPAAYLLVGRPGLCDTRGMVQRIGLLLR